MNVLPISKVQSIPGLTKSDFVELIDKDHEEMLAARTIYMSSRINGPFTAEFKELMSSPAPKHLLYEAYLMKQRGWPRRPRPEASA